jgi:hypothetical protein
MTALVKESINPQHSNFCIELNISHRTCGTHLEGSCTPSTTVPGPSLDMLIGFKNPYNYPMQTDLSPIVTFISPRSGLLLFREDLHEF